MNKDEDAAGVGFDPGRTGSDGGPSSGLGLDVAIAESSCSDVNVILCGGGPVFWEFEAAGEAAGVVACTAAGAATTIFPEGIPDPTLLLRGLEARGMCKREAMGCTFGFPWVEGGVSEGAGVFITQGQMSVACNEGGEVVTGEDRGIEDLAIVCGACCVREVVES